jgi:hypothetical protein
MGEDLKAIAERLKISEETAKLWLDHGAPIGVPDRIDFGAVASWVADHRDLVPEPGRESGMHVDRPHLVDASEPTGRGADVEGDRDESDWVWQFLREVLEATIGIEGAGAKSALLSSDRSTSCLREFTQVILRAFQENPAACRELTSLLTKAAGSANNSPSDASVREVRGGALEVKEDVMREPPAAKGDDQDDMDVVVITPTAFIKAMISIAWSCFRHPFSATQIDPETGRVVHNESTA